MSARIAVVIPCYRVADTILEVIAQVPPLVQGIFVVDDHCPQNSADRVRQQCADERVTVLRHSRNRGVGAATLTGYRAAWEAGFDIAVKVDGDGQMDPTLIPRFIEPIARGEADYTKGNRFFFLRGLRSMPRLRLLGNSALSLVTKFTTGYWNVVDPTNGFTALHLALLPYLETGKLHQRFFFETDMLFRLGTLRAVVREIPMSARYGDENSNLKISTAIVTFAARHVQNFMKRIFYAYFLRDFTPGTIQLLLGLPLVIVGGAFGALQWQEGIEAGRYASAGTVMLAALPVLIGAQLLISALNWDIRNVPTHPIHPYLKDVPEDEPDEH